MMNRIYTTAKSNIFLPWNSKFNEMENKMAEHGDPYFPMMHPRLHWSDCPFIVLSSRLRKKWLFLSVFAGSMVISCSVFIRIRTWKNTAPRTYHLGRMNLLLKETRRSAASKRTKLKTPDRSQFHYRMCNWASWCLKTKPFRLLQHNKLQVV